MRLRSLKAIIDYFVEKKYIEMKRTKQRADRAGQAKPEHASGLRQFEGEDLSK